MGRWNWKSNCDFKGIFFIKCKGHQGEIISLNFSSEGDRLITGSFDKTARVDIYKNKKGMGCK